MKQKQKTAPKARNPFVQHLVKRPSGAHEKSYKTHRRDAKVALKKNADYSDKPIASLSSLSNGPIAELVQRWTFNPCQRGFEPHPIHHYFDDTQLGHTTLIATRRMLQALERQCIVYLPSNDYFDDTLHLVEEESSIYAGNF